MTYDPKKVAKLIAMREEGLDEVLRPRIEQIAKIVSSLKTGLNIANTVGNDFYTYIKTGAYSGKEEVSFDYFCNYAKDCLGLALTYSIADENGEYPVGYSITMPAEFATCEDKDLEKVVITQIYDDLRRHTEKKRREYKKAFYERVEFLIYYDAFFDEIYYDELFDEILGGKEDEAEAKGGE